MRKTFDAELQELNYEMIDMAAAAEDAIDVVVESLASDDLLIVPGPRRR